MRITAFTHEGTQPVNEDTIVRVQKNGITCFIIADGEGVGNGEIASSVTAKTIAEAFENDPRTDEEAICEYFERAQAALNEKAQEDAVYDNMYSSAAVLITDTKYVLQQTIGDCRIYRFKGKTLKDVSEDDTEAFSRYRNGEISYDDIRKQPIKPPVNNINTKERFDVVSGERIKASGDFSYIICSKGFWRAISAEEAEQALRITKTSKEWLSQMLKIIESKKLKTSENISAFTIRGV